MIRIEEPEGWILIRHSDHAALAAQLAAHWGNGEFSPPEPRTEVLAAVARHDDAWEARDAAPSLTREGRPSAFSRDLLGSDGAFEEMSLADYLAVRGRALEAVADDDPYAAVLISMHTVGLLAERADDPGTDPDERSVICRFIDSQKHAQEGLRRQIAADPARLLRGFELLSACDSLSLSACVRVMELTLLRRSFPRRDGSPVRLGLDPLGGDAYRVAPYPFDSEPLRVTVPARRLREKEFAGDEALRMAFSTAPDGSLDILIVR